MWPWLRVLASRGARAQAVDPAAPPGAPAASANAPQAAARPSPGYGLYIVMADVVPAALVLGGVMQESKTAVGVGSALFLLSGPVLHAAHREPGAALLSLGLRGLLVGGAWQAVEAIRNYRPALNAQGFMELYMLGTATMVGTALGAGVVWIADVFLAIPRESIRWTISGGKDRVAYALRF